ncbi:acetolactate synthase small subunit [Pseudomonadota bacterium]
MDNVSLITIISKNKVGMLSQYTKIFREYDLNIESLSVSKIDAENKVHKITAYLTGNRERTDRVCKKIEAIEGVYKVVNLMAHEGYFERELGIVKILNSNENTQKAMEVVNEFGASTVYSVGNISIFEITDFEEKVSEFINKMSKTCKAEILRSGIVATSLDEELILYK